MNQILLVCICFFLIEISLKNSSSEYGCDVSSCFIKYLFINHKIMLKYVYIIQHNHALSINLIKSLYVILAPDSVILAILIISSVFIVIVSNSGKLSIFMNIKASIFSK